MAIKITDLPIQTINNMSASDVLPITDVETGTTKKVTTAVLTQYLTANGAVGYTGSAAVGYTGSKGAGYTGSIGSISSLTFGTGIKGYVGSAVNTVTSFNGTAPVTTTIDSAIVATLTGEQTLTNKTLTSPLIDTTFTLYGANITAYTPFPDVTIAAAACDTNAYQEFSLQNLNAGSDASADLVLYNDAADVNSFFIDMGINSSGFSSVDYPLFTANSGYIFTGGGSGGGGSQPSNLFIGTSSINSDIVFFTEGVEAANRVMIISHTGNLLLGTTNDNLEHILQVSGASSFAGHIMPDSDDVHELGEPGVHWAKLYLSSAGGVEFKDGYRLTNSTLGTQCDPNVDTVVKTADLTDIRSAKVFVQIQGNEDGDATGLHTQSCDMVIVRRVSTGGVNTVDSVVYGVIYTSVAPIATLDARWNALTSAIEITARPTSATNPVYVRLNILEVARYII